MVDYNLWIQWSIPGLWPQWNLVGVWKAKFQIVYVGLSYLHIIAPIKASKIHLVTFIDLKLSLPSTEGRKEVETDAVLAIQRRKEGSLYLRYPYHPLREERNFY